MESTVLPCSRIVNGFRIVPFQLSRSDVNFKVSFDPWIWCVKAPYRLGSYLEYVDFWFPNLPTAETFAKSYTSVCSSSRYHSKEFWMKLYIPVRRFDIVLRYLSYKDLFLCS